MMRESKRKPVQYKKNVLVIEDEPDLRQLSAWLLEAEGHKVFQAADGDTGLKITREQPLDLIFLDIRMPGRLGWDVLTEIKTNPEVCDIPIIIFTASADVDYKNKAILLGAADYLIKPISAEQLKECLDRVLGNKPARTDTSQ